jgi:hypothetical protein
MEAVERMSRVDWFELGTKLYGPDPRKWEFRCVFCAHVQSHEAAKARKPDIGDTSNWIFCCCEGRYNKDVGCDWTLGGLFRIHKREVVDDREGKPEYIPTFLFAAEEDHGRGDRKTAKKKHAQARTR